MYQSINLISIADRKIIVKRTMKSNDELEIIINPKRIHSIPTAVMIETYNNLQDFVF